MASDASANQLQGSVKLEPGRQGHVLTRNRQLFETELCVVPTEKRFRFCLAQMLFSGIYAWCVTMCEMWVCLAMYITYLQDHGGR